MKYPVWRIISAFCVLPFLLGMGAYIAWGEFDPANPSLTYRENIFATLFFAGWFSVPDGVLGVMACWQKWTSQWQRLAKWSFGLAFVFSLLVTGFVFLINPYEYNRVEWFWHWVMDCQIRNNLLFAFGYAVFSTLCLHPFLPKKTAQGG